MPAPSPQLGFGSPNGLNAGAPTFAGTGSGNLVADHLKSPDDLSKIPALRKKLLKEQATLSAKLKTGAKDQLEATRDGLIKLQATRKDVSTIRDAFFEVEAVCSEGAGVDHGHISGNDPATSKSFRIISEVSQVHRNLVQTSLTLDRLRKLPSQIESLAISMDRMRSNANGPTKEILPLHFDISRLETFRNEAMQIGRTCSAEVRQTLLEYFAPLDGLVREFEAYLMELCASIMDLVRDGRASVVILLLKIIERESREDEKAAAIKLAKKANLEGAARFRSVVANARVIKLYRPKLMEGLDRANKELFDECWSRFGEGDQGSPANFLEHLDWLYQDLLFVKDEMEKVFPSDYNIYRFYVKSYHKHLGAILSKKVLEIDPEASVLLTLYQFSQEYKKTMTKELAVETAWLEPTLLGGKEQTIIDDYLGLITRKIDEWTANLMSDEVRTFVSRDSAPEESAEGLYGLQYAAILFQMVNQQVDVAADSGQASILVRAVSHACQAMRQSQATWLRILEQEFRKQREAKSPDEVTEGLVEYVIALANDQLTSADYGEALMARVEAMVSDKYKAQMRETIDNVINGYLDVSKRCTQVLVDLVFADLRPVVKDLFAFPQWYNEGTITSVVETIRDYTSDYSERVNPNLFDVLCNDLIDRFLTAYLGALRRTNKLRMPAAGERMRQDIEECRNMFTNFKSAEDVNARFEVLDMVRAMLTSSSTMVFLSYWTFAKAHGSHLNFVESLIRARDDLEKADVTAIMESARRKVKQENLSDVPEGGVTVVGRVEAAHSGNSGLFGGRLNLPSTKGLTSVSGVDGSVGSQGWTALAASARLMGAGWRAAASNNRDGAIPPVSAPSNRI
jgi:hypothetical protein